MCFNLFFPFVNGEHSRLLLNVLGMPNEVAQNFCFEKVLDKSEFTHFDFYIKCASKRQILFELKLSENGFATAANDQRHSAKLENIYTPALRGNVDESLLKPKKFFENYQLLRNISYLKATTSDTLVFVFPKRNDKLVQQVNEILRSCNSAIRSKIKVFYLEDLADSLLRNASGEDSVLSAHFHFFKEKYIDF